MENLSTIAEPVSLPIEVPARPDLFDHRFENRPVFPAVEAMEIMAGAVRSFRPRAAIEDMADIRFEKFLAVEKGADTIPVFCRLRAGNRGGIHAELRSRKKFSSGFSRTLVHASAEFSRGGGADAPLETGPMTPAGPGFSIAAGRLYRELVPFGPAFQTLTGEIVLYRGEAQAEAVCPRQRPEPGRLLGSSFVLDGAFHAACAWGQRFAGIVAFPVGIDRRRLILPTRKGERYRVRAVPTGITGQMLVFAIEIADETGRLRERVEGVRMRDVSAGRWKPPQWIKR